MIAKIESFERSPDLKAFTNDELKLFDADGFKRNCLKLTLNKTDDLYYEIIADIISHQYSLPVRYLQAVKESCLYISQKAQMSGSDKDITNADITIEPLNSDFTNYIQYTPINQSIPIGTVVTLNVSIPYNIGSNGVEPKRKFIWSNNLVTDKNIKDIIKKENPNSIRLEPWMRCVHYGAIDIGSEMKYKFVVNEVNTKIIQSFSLFNFRRYDPKKEFEISVFKCFNLTPQDVLKMIVEQDDTKECTKKFISEILDKCKK